MSRQAAGGPEGPCRPEPETRVAGGGSVAEILRRHVTLELEGIDRMYLNVYVPGLQTDRGVAAFFTKHRGNRFASSALMQPISERFISALERYTVTNGVPVVAFKKGQRKDDVAAKYRRRFRGEEGLLFIGKAQEKVKVFRTQRRRNPQTGATYPWLVPSTAMVNQYYIYAIDKDFGPFFLKFSSYFPYNAKLCINGHEYAKQQLSHRGIGFEALDNGILSCENVRLAQEICDNLSAEKIDRLLRKWLARLPHPFSATDRRAGYRYDLSILQAEFSLTQIFDRPLTGRVFFEEIIRENLDMGRPDMVQLVFGRRVTKKTPGRFRTRVITDGVFPSLHIDYKKSRHKQYFKEGRGGRIELVVNDTRDFGIGRRLKNLPALRKIGFEANRRLLDVQRLSHDCSLGEDALRKVVRPVEVDGQHGPALRFDDARVQALMTALTMYAFQLRGFSHKDLRAPLAQLLGIPLANMTPGRMTYDLRRLRLHGLIERIPKTHRYRFTPFGRRVALFFSRLYARILRPAFSRIHSGAPPGDSALAIPFTNLDRALADLCRAEKLAA
jgi:hypothetical protein